MVEFITLKSQLERCLKQQQQGSHDQDTESHDQSHEQSTNNGDHNDTPPSIISSQSIFITTPTSNTSSRQTSHASESTDSASGSTCITMATEAPPPSQLTPPTNQPWPVTSILSQVSSSHHTDRNSSPLSTHHLPAHLPPVSRLPRPSMSHDLITVPSGPDRTCSTATSASSTCMASAFPSNSTGSCHQPSHTSLVDPVRLREDSRSSSLFPSNLSRHQHRQQRDGSLAFTLSHDLYPHLTPPMQTHAPSGIVQPWVETSQRQHLHHVIRTTPTHVSPCHRTYHEDRNGRGHHGGAVHSDHFMPYAYTSTAGRVNHHSASTYSPASWSHDSHMTTSGAQRSRSYTSVHHPSHIHNHMNHASNFCTENYISSCYGYSNHHSSGQGHPSTLYQTTHQTPSTNGNVMSDGSLTTPPYPIQPHPQGGGSHSHNPSAVWRPYSERSRTSGFYLSDILSLPSETEATPIQLESTPPTGHRAMHSFLVNRLLDDIQ